MSAMPELLPAPRTKTHDHCKAPGCMEVATFFPHEEHPHVGFCQRHATRLLIRSVQSALEEETR